MSTTLEKRLYGRHREVAFLREWYASVMPAFDCPLLLLAGSRGVGKRALAATLVPHVHEKQGLFVTGRCYSPRPGPNNGKCPPDRPLRAVWDALNGVFNKVESLQRRELKAAILSEFLDIDDVETLMEMMPASRALLEGEELKGNGSQHFTDPMMKVPLFVKTKRLLNKSSELLVLRFVRSIAGSIPNLVLCLEHIETADSATFELLETLISDASARGLLLLVATYRDDRELTPVMDNLLSRTKKVTFEEPNYVILASLSNQVPRLDILDLEWDDIYRWTVDSMSRVNLSEDMAQSLVDLIQEKSLGNPQFIWHILRHHVTDHLHSEQALSAMHDGVPNSMDDVCARIQHSLNPGTVAVVETVAALAECSGGESINYATLDLMLRWSCANDVLAAQSNGIFDASDDGSVRFASVEYQIVVYSMISESRRAALHLKLGRRLWAQAMSTEDDQEEIVNHDKFATVLFLGAQNLQRGMELVSDMGELDTITEISIEAGKRAMKLSLFSFATFYFELAISAVGDRLWKTEWYDVSLALYNGVSEAYYCSTNFEAMEQAVEIVVENARTFQDKLQAYTTLVYSNSARQRLEEVMDLAKFVLREGGETFPSNPGTSRVLLEYFKIRRLFRGKSDRFFLSLPAVADAEKLTAIRMMSFMSFTSYLVNPNLSLLLVFRILRTILDHGISGPAITSFASYGYVLSIHMGHVKEGARFANLAMSFLERGEGLAWLPRIHFIVYGLLNRSNVPLRESLEPLRKANRLALKTGDMEGSLFVALGCVTNLFHSGEHLVLVEEELRAHIKLMSQLGQQGALVLLIPMWQVVCDLKGGATTPLQLNGDIVDATSAFNSAKKANNSTALGHYYVWRVYYLCLTGQFQASLDMLKTSREAQTNAIWMIWMIFFRGISSLGVAWQANGVSRWRNMSVGRKAAKAMKDTVRFCVANFGSKQALLEAEIAALEGKTAQAFSFYDTSIKLAKDQGFLLEEGLAYERLGHFHCVLGSSQAAPFLESARSVYERWGAQTLVDRMEKQLALLVCVGDAPKGVMNVGNE